MLRYTPGRRFLVIALHGTLASLWPHVAAGPRAGEWMLIWLWVAISWRHGEGES